MAQITETKSVRMNCIEVEHVNYELRLEQVKTSEVFKSKQMEKKPAKKRLSKLFKKAELNAKYSEQIIPINNLRRQRVYRDYRVL